jgi:putative endonuclease
MAMRRGYHTGLSAEDIALALYMREGMELLSRRWRCAEGEIDLVLRNADGLVFAEVKARRTLDAASGSVSSAQWRRIGAAASRYLAEKALASSACRFDLVLVDGMGRCTRIENAATFDGW